MNIYKEFDNQAVEYKSICKSKCCICCFDYFYISEAEFYTILHYILQKENNETYINKLISKALELSNLLSQSLPSEYKKIHSNELDKPIQYYLNPIGNDLIRLKKPCIFLNSKNKCEIYEVRPLICRQFGTILDSRMEYNFACKYVKYSHNIDYSNTTNAYNADNIFTAGKFFRIPKPILYWFSDVLPLIQFNHYDTVRKICELDYEKYVQNQI